MSALTKEFPEHLMKIAEVSFSLQTNVQASGSALSPTTRRRGVLSSVWVANMTFAAMGEDTWRELSAFISSLDGQFHFMTFFDPARKTARGSGFAAPSSYQLTYGGNSYGFSFNGNSYGLGYTQKHLILDANAARGTDTITVRNLVAGTVGALKADDMFELGGNLYRVIGDVNSDANGKSTIEIRPRLRKGHALRDGLNFANPRGRFILTGSEAYSQSVTPPKLVRSATLTLIEAPDIGVVY